MTPEEILGDNTGIEISRYIKIGAGIKVLASDALESMKQYADQETAALRLQYQTLLDTIERDYVHKNQVETAERSAFEAGRQTLYRSDKKTLDELFKDWKEKT